MNTLLIGLLGLSASVSAASSAPERSAMRSSSHDLPLTFEVNQGQTDARVDFLARGEGYTLFLTPTEAVFALNAPRASSKRSGNGRESPQPDRRVIRMQLVAGAADPQVQGLDGLPGKVNYFRGNDASRWRANVPTFKRVRYTSVYPGVDLIYYGQPQQLEYDFIVAPGADPTTIKLAFAGVEDATVDARGDLVLNTAGGPLRFHKPLVYQVQEGRRRTIEGGYVRSAHEIGFRLGAYDRTRPLIIDPVLSYSTYLGGNNDDQGRGIALDATGTTYVTGSTLSTDFPTANALQPEHGEFEGFPQRDDAFVAKLTPDGTALVYATYLGGNDQDIAFGIAVDSSGAASISGLTRSTDFPTARALQAAKNRGSDAFVAKLSADGSQLVYSTYLGGRGNDSSAAIALDVGGAAYIAGETSSPDFPTTDGFQPVCVGVTSQVNAFVAKLTPDGSALAYSTYLGGTDLDFASDIVVDSVGAAYVTGQTWSADFPTVSPLHPFRRLGDAFVTKLAPDGKRLIYSTYLGGNHNDEGRGIAVDLSGAAYVTGRTLSTDFPTMNPLQLIFGGQVDGFVAKLAPEGGALTYATYLGGSFGEEAQSVTVDGAGAAYVTGFTASTDFPTMNPLQAALSGGSDAFISKLAPNGTGLVYSTYLGGSQDENGWAIAVDPTGAAYVTGFTRSRDFPIVQPVQATIAIGPDAFIAKLTGDSLAGPPGSGSISGSQNGGDDGGGSIDAFLAILLAQLALARALRRNISVA